jgi:hypothetical protein
MYLAYRYIKKKRAKAANRNASDEAKHGSQPPQTSEEHQQAGNGAKVNDKDTSIPQTIGTLEAQDGPADQISREEINAETRRRRIYRWKLIIALFPCQFLASVDLTIVSTALTTIASHFSTFGQLYTLNVTMS